MGTEAKRPRMLWLFFVFSTLLQQTSATGWTLLLRQTYGAGWFSYSDWYRNAHNPDAELFSRLGDIESFRGSDNTFHFHLWYPELGAGNEWKQTSNPMALASSGVTGYQAINISSNGNYWGGLEHNNQLCLLDGSVGEGSDATWWYAIGSFGDFQGGIPGPGSEVVHQVELYVWDEEVFQMGQIFQSGMVLQSAQENLVWGYNALESEPSFSFATLYKNGVLVVTLDIDVSADGSWQTRVPPQEAGTGYVLTVQSGEQLLELQDLSFGEVWVCSGQSNMEFTMWGILDSENELDLSAAYTEVKFTKVNKVTAGQEMTDLWGGLSIPWNSPQNRAMLSEFSAVCFLYGRVLYDHLKVPIGLIESSWGGTSVETWMPDEAIENCGLNKLPDYGQGIQNEESQCWHAMMAPLTRLTIRGAIWYQGETNVWNENRDLYGCAFPSMIDTWRKIWSTKTGGAASDQFPFGFVQLGTNAEQKTENNPDSSWPLIRWHQTADFGVAPNSRMNHTFMSAAMDTHDPESPYGVIHPRDKLTVANRLAWAGLALEYGRADLPSQGPQPKLINGDGGSWVFRVDYDQPITVNSFEGWQVCTAASVELCNHLVGWKDISASSSDSQSVYFDLTAECSTSGCSGLAYLWRETPCLVHLSCPIYSAATPNLPATPWIWSL